MVDSDGDGGVWEVRIGYKEDFIGSVHFIYISTRAPTKITVTGGPLGESTGAHPRSQGHCTRVSRMVECPAEGPSWYFCWSEHQRRCCCENLSCGRHARTARRGTSGKGPRPCPAPACVGLQRETPVEFIPDLWTYSLYGI